MLLLSLLLESGEIDRDGTIVPLKLASNVYKDLAHVMAKLGVVTLRFDKRGVGKSDGDIMKTGMWDLVSDIESTITYLKE